MPNPGKVIDAGVSKLVLIRNSVPIHEQARNLARLQDHILTLRKIYKDQCTLFLNRVLARADLTESVSVVAIDELAKDLVVQLRIER